MSILSSVARSIMGLLRRAGKACAEGFDEILSLDIKDWGFIGLFFGSWGAAYCGLVFRPLWTALLLLFSLLWAGMAGHQFGTMKQGEHRGRYCLYRDKHQWDDLGWYIGALIAVWQVSGRNTQLTEIEYWIRHAAFLFSNVLVFSLVHAKQREKCEKDFRRPYRRSQTPE